MASFLRVSWSKSLRIKIMIVIDTTFFLLELISGFLAHSLALTADAFHMVYFPEPTLSTAVLCSFKELG